MTQAAAAREEAKSTPVRTRRALQSAVGRQPEDEHPQEGEVTAHEMETNGEADKSRRHPYEAGVLHGSPRGRPGERQRPRPRSCVHSSAPPIHRYAPCSKPTPVTLTTKDDKTAAAAAAALGRPNNRAEA